MGFKTGISWCDHTHNAWWGCTPAPGDPGCTNCYALRDSRRYGLDVFGPHRPRRFFGADHWRQPLKWDRLAAGEGRMHTVFCNSMGDIFEDYQPEVGNLSGDLDYWREKLWALIEITPHLFWLLLTKHPENIARMLPSRLAPAPNLALGVTAANQEWSERRLPLLLAVPAALHFVSVEPQLSLLDLTRLNWPGGGVRNVLVSHRPMETRAAAAAPRVGWVIAGGESGPRARPTHPEWPRDLARQCRAHGVPFFYKQVGEWAPVAAYPPQSGDRRLLADGRTVEGDERTEARNLATMRHVGRKSAGDLLDGEQHHGLPNFDEIRQRTVDAIRLART